MAVEATRMKASSQCISPIWPPDGETFLQTEPKSRDQITHKVDPLRTWSCTVGFGSPFGKGLGHSDYHKAGYGSCLHPFILSTIIEAHYA
jgi:hypothetical protein